MKRFVVLSILSLCYFNSNAQRGKDLAKTISAAAVVNEYTALTADAPAGSTTLNVTANTLNANNRFAGPLAPGDLILIIQMQGASLKGTLIGDHCVESDSLWGEVTNYNNGGFYEFQQVNAIPGGGTSLVLDCGLAHSYTAAGHVQVVRVPRYASLTINSGGNLSCDLWQGSTGGVLAVEVLGNTVIASGGKIDVSSKGFRGGIAQSGSQKYGVGNFATTTATAGAAKGEGVGGWGAEYDLIGGRYGKGAAGNAGGGGNAHNGGGAGGGNGGVVASWNGHGIPDLSNGYSAAWNLDYPWIANTTSPGGGHGGYTFSSKNTANPLTNGPGNGAVWGGDARSRSGGFGGRPLDYSTGRLFMGGGGGAGDEDNNVGGGGGMGGGLVYVMNYGTLSGAGQVIANGGNGASTLNSPFAPGIDGAGGAGAGGTIVLNSVQAITGVSVAANGGNGGNHLVQNFTTECEGPGGGGGGGYVATSNGAIAQTATGGTNGTTNNSGFTNFPPNGATKGGTGTTNAAITNFTIAAVNDTICSGAAAVLTATLNGAPPPGTTIEWYTTATGGAPVGTGSPFTTPVINSNTTYFVGSCAGTYRIPVLIVIAGKPVAKAGSPVTICPGGTTTLTASGGSTYSWSPATGLSSTNTASTVASPTVTTSYTVTVSNGGGCTDTASVKVTVGPGLSVTATATPAAICSGKSSSLQASGANTYSWTPAAGLSSSTIANPQATPASTQTYTVTGKDLSGCTGTAQVLLTVNQRPLANPGPPVSECGGTSVVLNGSGGGTYSWSPATGLSSTSVPNPTATVANTSTYTLTVSDANGCRDSATVTVTFNPKPLVKAGTMASTCTGGSVSLQASGAATYTWSPAAGLSSTTVSNPTASPAATTQYTVTGTDSKGCVNSDTVTVAIGSNLTITLTKDSTICQGAAITLNAGGATSYTWTPSTGLSSTSIPNPIANPGTTQTYTVTGTNAGGCTGSNHMTLTVNPTPGANAGPNQTICAGSSVNLAGTGNGTYSWSPSTGLSSTTVANPAASPAATTTYTLTVTSSNTCTSGATVVVTVNQLPVVSASGPPACAGSTVLLQATGASSYTWSPSSGLSSTTVSNPVASLGSSPVTYTVTGTDANNCTASSTITITPKPLPRVAVLFSDTLKCAPHCINFTGMDSSGTCASSVFTFGDGTSSAGSTVFHCYAIGGLYTVTYKCTDASGCVGKNQDTLRVLSTPVASFISGGPLIEYSGSKPDSVCVTNTSVGAVSWLWSFGNGGVSGQQQPSCISYGDSGVYCIRLHVTANNGCTDSTTQCIHLERKTEVVYVVPNVFSPNGDGINDVFQIRNSGLQSMSCLIYDRWGKKLYEITSPGGSWDGKSGNSRMSDGVYYYVLSLQTVYGDSKTLTGFVQLLSGQ
jgi:gliding motility-associated-like protein